MSRVKLNTAKEPKKRDAMDVYIALAIVYMSALADAGKDAEVDLEVLFKLMGLES